MLRGRNAVVVILLVGAALVLFGSGCKEDKNVFIILAENPPVVNPIPDQTSPVDTAFSLDMAPYVSDDNDALIDLTFTVTTGLGSFTGSIHQHTFSSVGTETVYFEVQDTKSQPATGMFNVIVYSPPLAEFVADVTSGNPSLDVQFTNLSTGTIASYEWDFDGDSVVDSTSQNPTHTYALPGTYTVSLSVSCTGGSDTETKAGYIVVTPTPPAAEFVADATLGTAPFTVNFTDLSTGDIDTWAWDFGDTGTSGAQDPSHTYTSPGWYTVSLTVTGLGGTDTMTKHAYVQVAGNIWYVDGDYTFATGTGTTPGDPFQEIWSGINAATDLDLVLIADSTYSGSSNTDLDFGGKLVALRASGSNCVVDCAGSTRAFTFQSGETNNAVLDGLVIIDGSTAEPGAGIRCVDSSPTIVNCTLMGNVVPTTGGGGIALVGACSPVINNCWFEFNQANTGNGGAIYCGPGSIPTVLDCTFRVNFAGPGGSGSGGAIYLESVTGASITGCSFETNIAITNGAVINATSSSFTINDCEFFSNICMESGGAIWFSASTAVFNDCEITGNQAQIGGGIVATGSGSTLVMNNCTVSRNAALLGGGAIFSDSIAATLQDTTISSNVIQATDNPAIGGGLYISGSQFILTDCTIDSNVCSTSDMVALGGGVMVTSSDLTMTGCSVSLNRLNALYNFSLGGGVYAENANITLTGCTVNGNAMTGPGATGGGLHITGGSGNTSLTDSTFNSNTAEGYVMCGGGGVYIGALIPATLTGCIITANSTRLFAYSGQCFGGGIYSDSGEATMLNCTISDNVASGFALSTGPVTAAGGGVFGDGGSMMLTGCTLSRNKADVFEGMAAGGGLLLASVTGATVTDCDFSANVVRANSGGSPVQALGGGIFLEGDMTVIFKNSSITDSNVLGLNGMTSMGGAVYIVGSAGIDVRMTNCLLTGNTALMAGGAFYLDANTNLDLTNCTVAGNEGLFAGGGIYLDAATSTATMTNCILWGNTGAISGGKQAFLADGSAVLNLFSSDYSDGANDIAGSGVFTPDGFCITDNPIFVPGPFGKYYLSQVAAGQPSDSPCADAGTGTISGFGIDNRTTRSDEVADTDPVDMGYHYKRSQ